MTEEKSIMGNHLKTPAEVISWAFDRKLEIFAHEESKHIMLLLGFNQSHLGFLINLWTNKNPSCGS